MTHAPARTEPHADAEPSGRPITVPALQILVAEPKSDRPAELRFVNDAAALIIRPGVPATDQLAYVAWAVEVLRERLQANDGLFRPAGGVL